MKWIRNPRAWAAAVELCAVAILGAIVAAIITGCDESEDTGGAAPLPPELVIIVPVEDTEGRQR